MEKSKLIASILLSTALFFSSICTASPLTPEAALSRAIGNTGHKNLPARGMKDYRLVYTEPRSNSDEAAVYVFATGDKGYIIASADDVAYPVLGYSDEPFDESAMSLGWIKEYARQIEAADSTTQADDKYPFKEYDRIEPMIKTHWGNGSIYRDHTPQIDGKPCHPGDMAVAMAQIMNYHKYPAVGQGKKTYLSEGKEIKYDFSTLKLDWDAMLPAYDENCTDEQKSAIAELIYACGVAANMRYTPNISVSDEYKIGLGLVTHFGYDKAIRVENQFRFTTSEWQDMLYNQLKNFGPTIYTIHIDNIIAICDGYNGQGFFHFNSMNSKLEDGFYRLSALYTIHSASNWREHYFISQISPTKLANQEETYLFLTNGPIWGNKKINEKAQFSIGDVIKVGNYLYNYSIEKVIGKPLIEFKAENGNLSYGNSTLTEDKTINPADRIEQFNIQIPNLEEGRYTVSVKFLTTDNKIHPVKLPADIAQTNAIVKDGIVTFENIKSPKLKITCLNLQNDIYIEEEFEAKIEFQNEGDIDVCQDFCIAALNKKTNKMFAWTEPMQVKIGPHEDKEFINYPKFTNFIESESDDYGDYLIRIVDPNKFIMLFDKYYVQRIYPGVCPAPMGVKSFSFEGDIYNADFNNLNFVIKVQNRSGVRDIKSSLTFFYYFGHEYFFDFNNIIFTYDNPIISQDRLLYPLEEYECRVTLSINNIKDGEKYTVGVGAYLDDYYLDPYYCYPLTAGVSGIEDVTVDGGEAEYYNLQGVRVDNPSHGYYIKRSGNSTSKVYIP